MDNRIGQTQQWIYRTPFIEFSFSFLLFLRLIHLVPRLGYEETFLYRFSWHQSNGNNNLLIRFTDFCGPLGDLGISSGFRYFVDGWSRLTLISRPWSWINLDG